MTTKKQQIIANVNLNKERPTQVTFDQLYNWIIWQFPRPKEAGLCGAVHPPIPFHSWYPAIIQADKQNVQVFAHLDDNFSTPENAADYFGQGNIK